MFRFIDVRVAWPVWHSLMRLICVLDLLQPTFMTVLWIEIVIDSAAVLSTTVYN